MIKFLSILSFFDEVEEFKDLGLLTNNGLCWNSHIDVITAKANRMLVLIKRTCMDLKDKSTFKDLVLFPC